MSLASRLTYLWLAAAAGLAACAPITLTPAAPEPGVSPLAPTAGAPTQTPAAPAPAITATLPPEAVVPTATPPVGRPGLATVPPTPEPLVGELPPDLEARLRADVEARAGLPATALRLIRAEAVTWSDGALGCPQPGLFYTQALEEGYWVVWQAEDGREFDYRATQRGTFFLCAKAAHRIEVAPPATVTPASP